MTKLEIFKKLQSINFGWQMKRPCILKEYTKEELLKEYEKIKKSIDKKENYLYNDNVKNEKEE